ncbi:MAG: hypothetical protein KJ882_07125 [Proteobacteria bacterium]|nr:hypothetical protein [Pseudomonadota bacterium]
MYIDNADKDFLTYFLSPTITTSESTVHRVTAFGINMSFNNFVKHPNRHAGPDPVSRIQWDYWFPAFAGMTKVEFSSFLHVYEI